MLSEGQAEEVWRRFRLNPRKDWLKDVARGIYYRDLFLVPEGSDFYPFVEKAGVGVHMDIPTPRSSAAFSGE